jgi:hypothetical protein
MIKHMDKYVALTGLLLVGACNNEDMPTFEPTDSDSDSDQTRTRGRADTA